MSEQKDKKKLSVDMQCKKEIPNTRLLNQEWPAT